MCHDTPEGDDTDDSASLSTNQSPTTLVGDFNGHVKGMEHTSYNRVDPSLGIDTAVFTLDPQFDAHQITGSPMGVSRPSMAKSQWAKPEETDSDSWTSLVVDGCDPPPPFDMPDLVCSPMVFRGRNCSRKRLYLTTHEDDVDAEKSQKLALSSAYSPFY